MPINRFVGTCVATFAFLAVGAIARGADAPATQPVKPYPLATCVVSGEKIGEMGEGKTIVYEGREIRFCCPSCEKDFRKNPAKYLTKIDEAAAAAPATQPSMH